MINRYFYVTTIKEQNKPLLTILVNYISSIKYLIRINYLKTQDFQNKTSVLNPDTNANKALVISRIRVNTTTTTKTKTTAATNKSPAKKKESEPDSRTPKRMTSFQQRKQIQKEFLEKLAHLKSKIVTRKLAYIWLRKYFYRQISAITSTTQPNRALLLPSQIK